MTRESMQHLSQSPHRFGVHCRVWHTLLSLIVVSRAGGAKFQLHLTSTPGGLTLCPEIQAPRTRTFSHLTTDTTANPPYPPHLQSLHKIQTGVSRSAHCVSHPRISTESLFSSRRIVTQYARGDLREHPATAGPRHYNIFNNLPNTTICP